MTRVDIGCTKFSTNYCESSKINRYISICWKKKVLSSTEIRNGYFKADSTATGYSFKNCSNFFSFFYNQFNILRTYYPSPHLIQDSLILELMNRRIVVHAFSWEGEAFVEMMASFHTIANTVWHLWKDLE